MTLSRATPSSDRRMHHLFCTGNLFRIKGNPTLGGSLGPGSLVSDLETGFTFPWVSLSS